MSKLANVQSRNVYEVNKIGQWRVTTSRWMAAAFLIALALSIVVLALFGAGVSGTELALRVTARWSFLLFWLAYVGGAMARLFGPFFDGLARCGREFGLAFASAHLIHVALVIWLFYIATEPPVGGGGLVFFSAGLFWTYLLALFSLPRLRRALGPRVWRTFRAIALEYIAIVFAVDFILHPLQAVGLGKYPRSYLPFAIMLAGGAGLRIAVFFRSAPIQLPPTAFEP